MTTYRRSPSAIWRVTHQLLVAAVPPNPPTRIAGSAGLVWAHLAEPVTVDQLVELLLADVDAPAAAVRNDVVALLAQLAPLGLVEVTQ